jgi:hypothetical protein
MGPETAAPIIRKSRGPKRMRDFETQDHLPEQKPLIGEDNVRTSTIVHPETPLVKKDFEKLAFAEEPVTILIHRSGEKFSPNCTDLISVNGRHAEVLFSNGWVPVGYLPRGKSITVKRKVVEVLARSKQDHVKTVVIERDNEDPRNYVERATINTMPFQMIEDKNPLGVEWLSQLLRMNG